MGCATDRAAYTEKQARALEEVGIIIPNLSYESFKVGKHCPGKESCYGVCYGTKGVVSSGIVHQEPCKNPLLGGVAHRMVAGICGL